jgi:hypothetical protein
MRANARDWQKLGCAAVLGALVAFPAGFLFGRAPGQSGVSSDTSRNGFAHYPGVRNPFDPKALSDPFVVRRHRKMVEELETYCRKTGKYCTEAEEARKYLDERGKPSGDDNR